MPKSVTIFGVSTVLVYWSILFPPGFTEILYFHIQLHKYIYKYIFTSFNMFYVIKLS